MISEPDVLEGVASGFLFLGEVHEKICLPWRICVILTK